jgi:hypothetical protein
MSVNLGPAWYAVLAHRRLYLVRRNLHQREETIAVAAADARPVPRKVVFINIPLTD